MTKHSVTKHCALISDSQISFLVNTDLQQFSCGILFVFFDLDGTHGTLPDSDSFILCWTIVHCARCISNIHAVRSIDIPGMVETGFIYAAFLSVALFIMALGHYIITRKLFRGLLSTITSHIHNKYRSSTLFHAIVSSVIGKFLCVFSAIEIIS